MPSRNVSLWLQRLREKDSGSYRCSVNVQDKQGTSRGHSSKTLKLDVWGEYKAQALQDLPAPKGGQAGLPPTGVRKLEEGKTVTKGSVGLLGVLYSLLFFDICFSYTNILWEY